jgi:hypothetical protein
VSGVGLKKLNKYDSSLLLVHYFVPYVVSILYFRHGSIFYILPNQLPHLLLGKIFCLIILASYHSIILPQDFMLLILFITENYKFVVNLQFSSIYQIEGGPWPWHNGKVVALLSGILDLSRLLYSSRLHTVSIRSDLSWPILVLLFWLDLYI